MTFITRLLQALGGACFPALGVCTTCLLAMIYSLVTMTIGSGEMGPGLAIPFLILIALLGGLLVGFISFIILLCAGFTWKLTWWLTGITTALTLIIYIIICLEA